MTLGVVILFWKVECFFDPFDDPLKDDDEITASAERRWTWSRFEKKRDGIAQTIMAVADEAGDLPALVGLAEVENRLVVSQLVRKTPLEELGYGYIHRESPDTRGIDVALLYRIELLRVIAVDSLQIPDVVTRDILYVNFRFAVKRPLEGEDIHVFVVHLPSKRGGERVSAGRREAALAVLDRAVDSLMQCDPENRIVVMGDFNETGCEVAGLVIPPFAAPPAVPGTLRYHGRWEQIDWFFVSPTMKDSASMQIFSPPFLLEPDATYFGLKPRRTYLGPRYHGGLSDHLPIYLKFFP